MVALVKAHHHSALGKPGCRERSSPGTWASVSVSSGPICTNCDEVQHAVHSPQGTSGSGRPVAWRDRGSYPAYRAGAAVTTCAVIVQVTAPVPSRRSISRLAVAVAGHT